MMSASAISARIRAMKKKMEEDDSGDATDLLIMKNKEPGEMLSENDPKDHDEDPSLESVMAKDKMSEAPMEEAPDSDEPYGEDGIQVRKDKLRKMMMRMGK